MSWVYVHNIRIYVCCLDDAIYSMFLLYHRAVWVIGWSEDQVLGKNPALFGHPNDGPIAEKHLKEFQECSKFDRVHIIAL